MGILSDLLYYKCSSHPYPITKREMRASRFWSLGRSLGCAGELLLREGLVGILLLGGEQVGKPDSGRMLRMPEFPLRFQIRSGMVGGERFLLLGGEQVGKPDSSGMLRMPEFPLRFQIRSG